MKHRVDVVEDVFRADGLAQVARPFGHESHAERGRGNVNKSLGEVGDPPVAGCEKAGGVSLLA